MSRAVFTPQTLNLMLNLRLLGYSFNYLASIFECDKKAIKYQCKKYGVFSWDEGNFNLQKAINILLKRTLKEEIRKEEVWKYVGNERINNGRSYQDYLFCSPSKNHTNKVR